MFNELTGEFQKNSIFCRIFDSIKDEFFVVTNCACQKSEVCLPLRINWCGTWTDTPPYCLDNGGKIINAAIKINGKKPVHACCTACTHGVEFEYEDSGRKTVITSVKELLDCSDPTEPFSLMKAALISSGIIHTDKPVPDIHISAGVMDIPQGSGLGTSSILILAIIKAIYGLYGINQNDTMLINRVLIAEQLMSTGGGWQDQAGCLYPGINLLCSEAGDCQKIARKKLICSPKMADYINNRLFLVYIPRKYYGRTVLCDIIKLYENGKTEKFGLLVQQAEKQAEMIESGDISGFDKMISLHVDTVSSLSKIYIDEEIKKFMLSCNDSVRAFMPCGAGGGGFMQVFVRDGITQKLLEQKLLEYYPDTDVLIYKTELDLSE